MQALLELLKELNPACCGIHEKELKKIASRLKSRFDELWVKYHRSERVVIAQEKSLLERAITIPAHNCARVASTSTAPTAVTTSGRAGPGRPPKDFQDCSIRTKRRKVESLTDNFTCAELSTAHRISLYRNGRRDAATLVDEISSNLKAIGTLKEVLDKGNKKIYLPAEQGLATLVAGHLSRSRYNSIRQVTSNRGSPSLPPWGHIEAAKTQCYPEGITVDSTRAEVSLQSLVDHTVKRLTAVHEERITEVLKDAKPGARVQMKMRMKAGMDGCSGLSKFNQR